MPTIEIDRLTLRPFEQDDAPTVQRLAGDYEVARGTLTMPHPYEDGVAEAWIATHRPMRESGEGLVLAMTTVDDGVVGAIGLVVEEEHQRGELGYWVGVPYWGRGYATEACAGLLRYGFDVIGLNRIEAQHFLRNPASGRVMQKLGMRFEGIARERFVQFGELEDAASYGMLAHELPD
jgi:RimJ/RimL family protein N-acetyltransferase